MQKRLRRYNHADLAGFGMTMKRFIEGEDRHRRILFPGYLDDYLAEVNPVRVIDVFGDELDLSRLGFERIKPKETGRPAYHPALRL